MAKYGILADNLYCTGCHACELACKNEHELPSGQWGIKVLELGPWRLQDGVHWEYRYVPILTYASSALPMACSRAVFFTVLPQRWNLERSRIWRNLWPKKGRWQ